MANETLLNELTAKIIVAQERCADMGKNFDQDSNIQAMLALQNELIVLRKSFNRVDESTTAENKTALVSSTESAHAKASNLLAPPAQPKTFMQRVEERVAQAMDANPEASAVAKMCTKCMAFLQEAGSSLAKAFEGLLQSAPKGPSK